MSSTTLRATLLLHLLAALGLGLAPSPLPARAEPTSAKPLSKEQQEKLKERDRFGAQTRALRKDGKLAEAIAAAEKMLALERQVFGDVHEEVAGSLEQLAEMHQQREDFAAARKAAREVLTIRTKLLGVDHWQSADARRNLESIDRWERLTPDQRRQLQQANQLMSRVGELSRVGKYRDALRPAQQALELRQGVFGENHLLVASSLHWIGWLYMELGDDVRAESPDLRALAIRKQILGENHPEYATILDNLASVYIDRRDYAKAEPLRRRALEIRKVVVGVKHHNFATSLHNLAFLYREMKDYPRAEALFQEALQIKKESPGEKDPSYAATLGALAGVYLNMRDYARAEALYRQSLEINKAALGETHIECARASTNLAFVYQAVGDYDRAEACFRQALAIVRQALGERHPWYSISLDNLADVSLRAANYDQAETLYRQEIALLKKLGRDKQPQYARALNQLAVVHGNRREYAKAQACYQESLAVKKIVLGEKHPDYLLTLRNLAVLDANQRAYDRAIPLIRRVVAARKEVLGADHPEYRDSLELLVQYLGGAAELAENREDFAAARQLRQEVLDFKTQLRGKDHGETADARRELAHIDRLEKLTAEQRARLRQADQLLKNVGELNRQKNYSEALPLAREMVELRTNVLGGEHRLTGDALHWLGYLLNEIGSCDQAEQTLRQTLTVYKRVLGADHPSYADALKSLAVAHGKKGEHALAVAAEREVLAIRKKVLGTRHPEYAKSVNDLAVSLRNLTWEQAKGEDFASARKGRQEIVDLKTAFLGEKHWQVTDARLDLAYIERLEKLDSEPRHRLEEAYQLEKKIEELYKRQHYREALPLAERAYAIRKELLGETHWVTVHSFSDLGRVYLAMGDRARAEPNRRRYLEMVKPIYGEKHPTYATSLINLAGVYEEMGAHAKAEPLYRQALALRKEFFGENHSDYAACLNELALNCGARGDAAQEEFLLRQVVAIRKRLGGRDAAYAVNLGNLAVTLNMRGEQVRAEALLREAADIFRQAGGDKDPRYAWMLRSLATLYKDKGNSTKAEPLYRQALAIYAEVFGKENAAYAETLGYLAQLFLNKGDGAQARSLYEEVLRIQKRNFGERHPAYANALQSLGWLYAQTGDYGRAEAFHRQARDIRKLALGENHPHYADSLRDLAWLYQLMRDYARAEPLYRQGLAIQKRALGDRHPDYSKMLDEAGGLYLYMGDNEQALSLRRQALEIDRQVFGDKSPRYASALLNLGLVYEYLYDRDRAEKLYRQALAIHKEIGTDKDGNYSTILMNLGSLCSAKGDNAAAEPLLREALDLRRRFYGDKNPRYALAVFHLGWLRYKKGEHEDAERLLRQALALYAEALGEQHYDCAKCQKALAEVYAVRGDFDKAEALARQGLEIDRKHLEQSAAVQSERQQLAAALDSRHRLDMYLSLALRSRAGAERAYDHVLAWKGAVSSRQADMRGLRRLLSANGTSEAVRLYDDLVGATARLATLSLATPDPGEPERLPRDIAATSQEIERLEKALAQSSAAFRAQRGGQRRTARDIQAALPPDTVLIDVLDYWNFDPKRSGNKSQRRFLAFVVRRDALVPVDLGPIQPIRQALNLWRLALQRRFRTQGDDDLGAAVRRLIWQPLEEHLRGARVVLVSPDGDLARVPFAALPGSKKDSYLLEEVAVAVVPVPQLLPDLLSPRPADKDEPSLLLVGDVRYDGAAGSAEMLADSRAAARGSSGARMRWPALANTRAEVTAIADAFRRRADKAAVTQLNQGEATESAVRRQASAHRYLHFATHGYFAPKELRSALAKLSQGQETDVGNLFGKGGLAGFHPGLLSGLVLAGANRPLDLDRDDGILTALEVQALDLSGVELATLSACETGLGEQAAGEGVLGLQRAFQVAGARSAVAGLWQVDDAATRQLMVLFYDNLWRKKMPKLEALRQAQLWMLKEGDAWMRKEGISRGMIDVRVPRERLAKEEGRLPPYYWAAFALSGDWR